jgi:murein DD-endopeptidase MepM/ murein hydrolase activator NlpD
MVVTHREKLTQLVIRALVGRVLPVQRHILMAVALLFVAASVLLVLDARLPFPPPSERIIYDPTDLSLLFPSAARQPARQDKTTDPALSVGGSSSVQPPLAIMLYRVKRGDTISGIATKLGLSTDTISTFNRPEGRGVHTVTVGEEIRIPSQDGIYLTLNGDFDEICRKNKVAPEDVLAANSLSRGALVPGMQLFFPGVQHYGYARALQEGIAVALPLRGWESSPYGIRQDPFTGQVMKHYGVDIAAPMGSPVRSATNGVVRVAAYDSVLGNYVEVRAQLGYSYVYGHMSKILVQPGTAVGTGRVLGLVGDTGYATGPHLHFEVRKYGVPQNPKYYLPGIR